ncbi:hypothetical protein KY290_016648 [Solanum tuberosum]|uniref:Reverse transcriptase n=1 Tax=Solanum tuberosum TaxID=4113 RepID=A0ABQ7V915_SOLTU|nr:hypothetical protein KY284_015926 [Solanum tuberosum]KAH0760575.1 hypothetical protein KY290_016648 [Solanum tuberosum]
MAGRIISWTAKKLSYAGRVQLLRSVLFGIQAYWAQLFSLPTKVIKTIEAYCRSQPCWMVRKIIEAGKLFEPLQLHKKAGQSMTKTIYLQLIGDLERGLPADPKCVLCMNCDEDRDHLFAMSPYGIQVWNILLCWIGQPAITSQTWGHFLDWIIKCGKGKSKYARLFRMVST